MEFVEMAKLSVLDDEASTYVSRRPLALHQPVTDISMWVDGFPAMAVITATRFPHKVLELFTYNRVRRTKSMRGSGGWHMTTSTIGMCSLARISIGLSQIHA